MIRLILFPIAVCVLILLSFAGCALVAPTPTPMPTLTAQPTYTPPPTFTPPPTQTPLPTLTPLPTATRVPPTETPTPTPFVTPKTGDTVKGEFWRVKIVKVETADSFSSFSPTNADSQLLIITADVTYLGPPERGMYSPEAISITHIGADQEGFTNHVRTYRAENSALLTDFSNESLMLTVKRGETRRETFVTVFPKSFSEFLFYFPETQAIAFTLE